MRGFFSQFGDIKKLRLSRNKRTGKSKHYAFIEFESSEVAKAVASMMNSYILYGHKLVCGVVPLEKLHPQTFKGANKTFKKIPWKKIAREQHNKTREPKQAEKLVKKLMSKEKKKRQKLKDLGINYEFGGYAATIKPVPTHKKFI